MASARAHRSAASTASRATDRFSCRSISRITSIAASSSPAHFSRAPVRAASTDKVSRSNVVSAVTA
jgi:hypothetical protein